jgi:tRNA pseudouridine38-40 synthase
MKNFKLIIEYDGTGFHGWQRQSEQRSVQAEIEDAIAIMTRRQVTVNGSGRTDAGVHAMGQVANVALDTRLDATSLQKGLNRLVSPEVVIRSCREVSLAFHARYDARGKTYRYRIVNHPIRPAVGRQYVWWLQRELDTQAMAKALRAVKGTHDFKAFEAAGSPRSTTVRTLDRAELYQIPGSIIDVVLRADGFLRYMVRNIVGSLVAVGAGRRGPEEMARLLAGKDRRQAAATAPPQGLCLLSVHYDGDPADTQWDQSALIRP